MTDHGRHWIGAIPSNWKLVTLKSLISIQNGDWGNDPFEIGQGGSVLTCYRKADFTQTGTVESGETLRRIARKPFVRYADILLEKSGGGDVTPVGSVAIVTAPEPAACSNFLARLRANKGSVEPRFVWRFLSAVHASPQIWSLFKQTTGIQNIDMEALATLEVPLPDVLEQRRIADWLDLQTTRIDQRRELLAKKRGLLSNLITATISEATSRGLDRTPAMKLSGIDAVGLIPKHWNIFRLKEMTSKIGSGKTPLGGSSVYTSSGIVFLRSQNIWDDRIRLDDVVFISDQIHYEMNSTTVKPKDILLNITGASIGRSALVPEKFPSANVSQHVCIIRLRNKSLADYVALTLLSQYTKAQIAVDQIGAARDGLNFENIGQLPIPLPPSDAERKLIVDRVNDRVSKIKRQITLIDQLDDLLQQQRKAIIHEAVTGKIDLSSPTAAKLCQTDH